MHSEATLLEGLVYIAMVTLWAFALVSIFEGARRVRAGGFRRANAAPLVLGTLFCIAYSCIDYQRYCAAQLVIDALKPDKLAASPVAPKSDWSSERQQQHNDMLGHIIYGETGKLWSYTAADGDAKTYVPTQKELTEREEMVFSLGQLSVASNSLLVRSIAIPVSALLVAFAALFGSRRNAS